MMRGVLIPVKVFLVMLFHFAVYHTLWPLMGQETSRAGFALYLIGCLFVTRELDRLEQ